MLAEDQIKIIKKQLLEQIETQFPSDKKQEAKNQIKNMNSEELESFLQQNNLLKDQGKCIFCSIVQGESQSYKIAENLLALAVLEINPISKGHTLIIPKIHSKEISKEIIEFAKEISEALKTLNPKKIDITPSSMFGHDIFNVLPVYNNENLESSRNPLNQEEAKNLQTEIKKAYEKIKITQTKEEKPKEIIKPKPLTDKDTILPKRIP
ncbi:MAG: HIT domain-containing protein [archaeon]